MLNDLATLPPWEWPGDAKERLLEALAPDSDSEQRLLAAELAFHVADDEVAEALLARALDAREDDEVRAAAVIGLGPALEECDIEGFDDVGDPPLSRATFDRVGSALERLYRDAAVPALVRRRALEAAVRAPRDWHTSAVRAAWASGDASWRATAVFCMGYVPGFSDQVKEALASNEPELVLAVVQAAANGSADIGQAAEPTLLRMAGDRHTELEVRLDAIAALANVDSRESLELLETLASSPDEDVADTASEALAIRGEGMHEDLDW